MKGLVLRIILFAALCLSYTPILGQSATESKTLKDVVQQAESISSLRSILIHQNDSLLGEKYFNGASADHPYNIKSASKSIISILAGIAADRNELSIDQTLNSYFTDYFEANPDPKKEKITIRNLLSMQSGLETTSFYNYGAWVISDNWAEFQLDQPFEEEPGGEMVYSTGISHLLSVILTKATGMSTKAFAKKYLFNPLDIKVGGWDRDPQGYYMGGNNLALTPEGLRKIGIMMLNGGSYEGERIVPREWVRDSFKTYARSNFNPYDYGYMWWNRPVNGYNVHFAWGYGGQYIFVVQELEAVVVITNSLETASQQRTYKEPIFDLLADYVIPYLRQNIP